MINLKKKNTRNVENLLLYPSSPHLASYFLLWLHLQKLYRKLAHLAHFLNKETCRATTWGGGGSSFQV